MKSHLLNLKKIGLCIICCTSLTSVAQEKIYVQPHTQRFVEGESTFDRSKYFTFHSFFRKQDAEFENFKATYNLDKDYIGSRLFNSPVNKRNHKNTGSFSKVPKNYKGERETTNYVSTGHPNGLFYGKGVDYSQIDIQPFIANAVKYTVDYYKHKEQYVPSIFEPLNEPMVHAVDFYPQEGKKKKYIKSKITSIIEKICVYHRELAKGIHSAPELKNMKVGGFGSAFPEFETNNFGLWKARFKRFIDIAGEDVDLFTVHLYDGSGINNKGGRRSGSNSEAILDMIETYSNIKLGTVKPIAITEYGRLVPDQPNFKENGNYVPLVNAQAVRSQNHMVMNFIERGGKLPISIPFTIGKTKVKQRYSKSGLWQKQPDGSWELSQRKYFFEIWKDVKGKRVYTKSTNVDVQTQAFVNKNKLYLVLNNLNDKTQNVALNVNATDKLKKVQIKRLKIHTDKLPELTITKSKKAPDAISLDYGETIVITYQYKAAIDFNNTIQSKKHYAKEYLQPIIDGVSNSFHFSDINVKNGEAVLRLGVSRKHGASLQPNIKINGKELTFTGDLIRGNDQNKRKQFFGILEIPVAATYLKKGANTLDISFSGNGGSISSVILKVEQAEKAL
ncbi:hypothetical protein [Wenyingzhuangia sp. IMCC45574]